MTAFNKYKTIWDDTTTKTADNTEYSAGLTEKGNGTANDIGFIMYTIELWTDPFIAFPELWEKCYIPDYMLAVSKPVTSVSGLIDFGTTFFWRFFSDEDAILYGELSQAVTDGDAAVSGAKMGTFLKELFKTSIQEATSTATYEEVGYIQ